MKRVFFTGGSGKAGRHVVRYLADQGHRVLNADIVNLPQDGVDYLHVDVTNTGHVFSALSGHMNRDELRQNQRPLGFDAIVHFAAVPRILQSSDVETYQTNVMGTYNVLEAAAKLNIKKVIFASSETVYGLCFSHGAPKPLSLPVEEDDQTRPMDSYAMSKVVNEETARAFQRRTDFDVYGLRIGNVIEPDEYGLFADFCATPSVREPNAFNYIDGRDLGQAVDLCLQHDNLGFEIFNISNDQNSVDLSNSQIIEKFYPDVPLKRPLEEWECLYANTKLKNMLGFRPQHDWRQEIDR
jgi:nucleoside-diphosphate-sugar epimerase